MTSLTPASRSEEATSAAAYEGFFNGACTLVPSIGLTMLAYYRHPTFKLRTTPQSRTAIAIMPALFVAALSSELKLAEKMREIANETQHTHETVHWAEEQWKEHSKAQQHPSNSTVLNQSQHLSALYEESVKSSGVRVVPELLWYHQAANFTSANPLKVLLAVAVPAVGFIFYGKSSQHHLQLSSMIMHTRVFGQGLTLVSLLSIMGFKSYMDSNGRFISQEQADARVAEMKRVRETIQAQLSAQQQHRHELEQELIDLADAAETTTTTSATKSSHHHKNPHKAIQTHAV